MSTKKVKKEVKKFKYDSRPTLTGKRLLGPTGEKLSLPKKGRSKKVVEEAKPKPRGRPKKVIEKKEVVDVKSKPRGRPKKVVVETKPKSKSKSKKVVATESKPKGRPKSQATIEKEARKVKREVKALKPKRAPSKYNIFMGKYLKEAKLKHPNKPITEMMKKGAAIWKQTGGTPFNFRIIEGGEFPESEQVKRRLVETKQPIPRKLINPATKKEMIQQFGDKLNKELLEAEGEDKEITLAKFKRRDRQKKDKEIDKARHIVQGALRDLKVIDI